MCTCTLREITTLAELSFGEFMKSITIITLLFFSISSFGTTSNIFIEAAVDPFFAIQKEKASSSDDFKAFFGNAFQIKIGKEFEYLTGQLIYQNFNTKYDLGETVEIATTMKIGLNTMFRFNQFNSIGSTVYLAFNDNEIEKYKTVVFDLVFQNQLPIRDEYYSSVEVSYSLSSLKGGVSDSIISQRTLMIGLGRTF